MSLSRAWLHVGVGAISASTAPPARKRHQGTAPAVFQAMGEAAATPHRPSDARLPHLQAHIAGTPARALLRVCMMVDLLVLLYWYGCMAIRICPEIC